MKKVITSVLAAAVLATALTACGSTNTASSGTGSSTSAQENNNLLTGAIEVVSREDGSGTRGAFIELFGIEQKDADGNKVDHTTEEATISNSTSVMMTTVAGNPAAIGYISLGSLNDTVKALEIDGAAASVENIKSGTYKISRPFNVATKEDMSEAAQDFMKFILSKEGQAVVEAAGYISQDTADSYTASGLKGKIVVAGSSSVTPVMEKLKEAYEALNSGVEIEVLQSDSSTGMSMAVEGSCDIGMASRELKDSELEKGLTPTVIAMDGIAVVINKDNGISGMTSEQIKAIFTGEVINWEELS